MTDAEFKWVQAEIERLRSIAFGAEEDARTIRKVTIEECARVAEVMATGQWNTEFKHALERTAAAIRALKG